MRYASYSFTCIAALLLTLPAHADTSSFVVVVESGPLRGTYHLPVKEVSCFHSLKRRVYASGWKNFTPTDARALAEAGIEVKDSDAPGPKFGTVLLTFGDSDKTATHYEIYHTPLDFSLKGSHGMVMVRGATKDGVQIQVTVSCLDTMEID